MVSESVGISQHTKNIWPLCMMNEWKMTFSIMFHISKWRAQYLPSRHVLCCGFLCCTLSYSGCDSHLNMHERIWGIEAIWRKHNSVENVALTLCWYCILKMYASVRHRLCPLSSLQVFYQSENLWVQYAHEKKNLSVPTKSILSYNQKHLICRKIQSQTVYMKNKKAF